MVPRSPSCGPFHLLAGLQLLKPGRTVPNTMTQSYRVITRGLMGSNQSPPHVYTHACIHMNMHICMHSHIPSSSQHSQNSVLTPRTCSFRSHMREVSFLLASGHTLHILWLVCPPAGHLASFLGPGTETF